ncbi:YfiR family protein [Caulobacter segnis]|nr:YfiR family protein [Caulobacter segnis]
MVLGFPPSALGSRPGWRKWSSCVVATALAACVQASAAQAGEHEPGYALKAGYLAKFTPFVDWPDAAFEGPTSPFHLCIGGHDPFGGAIDRVAGGLRVGEHPVVVIRLSPVAKGADCHLLFLSASRRQTPQQMLAAVAGRPVLTVADETLDAPGAVVQFVTLESRLRFTIRADMAQVAGLTLSSKLLALSAQPRDGGR